MTAIYGVMFFVNQVPFIFGQTNPVFRFISLRSMLAAIQVYFTKVCRTFERFKPPLTPPKFRGEQAESYFFFCGWI